jgi:four helix bundle protein
MTYNDWADTVPLEIRNDVLWREEVYRLSLFAADLSWHEVCKLVRDRRTLGLSGQLYEAVGSISANFSEGYSRQSKKDQCRFYEYALGSAREARTWYYQARHVLSEAVVSHRMNLLTQIIKLLLTIIPSERGYTLKDDSVPYSTTPQELLSKVPFEVNTVATQQATRNT